MRHKGRCRWAPNRCSSGLPLGPYRSAPAQRPSLEWFWPLACQCRQATCAAFSSSMSEGGTVYACSDNLHACSPATAASGAPEQAALGAAFIVEGLLFAFHLEGSALNWKAHLLLVISIFAAAGAVLAELRHPGSALLGIVRAQLVLLQGVWFMQIAKLLFEGARACAPFPPVGSTLPDGIMPVQQEMARTCQGPGAAW